MLYVDLDDFKLVNDSFGHSAGDQLLCEVAPRLRSVTRASDVVARQGGDEFLILLADIEPSGRAEVDVAESPRRIAEQRARRAAAADRCCRTPRSTSAPASASASIRDDAADAETLLKHADIAMYKAKEAGRDGYQLFYAPAAATRVAQLSLAGAAAARRSSATSCVLHYQPLVELRAAQVVGAEALIRWQDRERGLVMPGDFIPLAERTGLIGPIRDWVIDEACRQSATWRAAGLDLYVSVNLPAVLLAADRDAPGAGHDRVASA